MALYTYKAIDPAGERSQRVQEAVRILDAMHVDFEYDGEMGAEIALDRERMAAYPFCRLSDTANVLIMPAFHSASISTHMLKELGGATLIGPLIVGLDRPVQIVPLGAKDTDIVIWDLVSETGLFKLRGHKGQVTGLHFLHPSNQKAADSAEEEDEPMDADQAFLLSTSKDALTHTSALYNSYTISARHRYQIDDRQQSEAKA